MTDQNLSRDFKGVWIPKEIWLDDSLDLFEKVLYAEIHSLDGEKGCFASNAYFCNFFNVKERKLIDAISNLKKKGLIYQESFDGRTRVLRTYKESTYAKFSRSDLQNSAGLTCTNLQVSPYIDNIVYNKEKSISKDIDQKPPNPQKGGKSQSDFAPPEKNKILRDKHVSTTQEEHQKLIDKFGPQKTIQAYKFLSDWKEEQPVAKRKGDDYRKILKWVISAVIDQEKRNKTVEDYYNKKHNDSSKKKGKGVI